MSVYQLIEKEPLNKNFNFICHAGPQDPVLINDKLARGFAKAWSVGSEQQEVSAWNL